MFILELKKNSKILDMPSEVLTKILMENYFNKAISAIKNLEDNIYKKTILDLIELLQTDI